MTDNIILEHLRAIRATQDRHTEQFGEVIHRLGRVETEVAGLHRQIAGLHEDFAGLSVRSDHIDRRLIGVERLLQNVSLTPSA